MVRKEIIVTVGCDGGCLTIEGKHYGDTGWQFRMVRNEMALYDDCVDDGGPGDIAGFLEHTDYLDSLAEALKLFDRYPYWPDLYVVEVHPEFVDEVLAEVRLRGGTSAEARWREALDRKRRESGLMKEQAPTDEEWERFKGYLAMCIADLSEDEFLIVSTKRANYFGLCAGICKTPRFYWVSAVCGRRANQVSRPWKRVIANVHRPFARSCVARRRHPEIARFRLC